MSCDGIDTNTYSKYVLCNNMKNFLNLSTNNNVNNDKKKIVFLLSIIFKFE